ncbi:hypothetical protein EPR50_G00170260 [Perca flavescens]|uniref:Uncharacterized protein n=1 Tax=Perca flavescens TaxID=8167 RepID=A0A484CJI1_PERFV|nr:hypothetical protein EPR50_G00170260 [Perca flavescens]
MHSHVSVANRWRAAGTGQQHRDKNKASPQDGLKQRLLELARGKQHGETTAHHRGFLMKHSIFRHTASSGLMRKGRYDLTEGVSEQMSHI